MLCWHVATEKCRYRRCKSRCRANEPEARWCRWLEDELEEEEEVEMEVEDVVVEGTEPPDVGINWHRPRYKCSVIRERCLLGNTFFRAYRCVATRRRGQASAGGSPKATPLCTDLAEEDPTSPGRGVGAHSSRGAPINKLRMLAFDY